MPALSSKNNLFTSEEGALIRQELRSMELDSGLITRPGYSANVIEYPDNVIPFVDKHLLYLSQNPKIIPEQYLANLRLMTKSRK